jgi:hypothetical protein
MAKQPTLTFNDALYFLSGTGDHNVNLCETDGEYTIFLNTLEETTAQFGWTLHAFCLTKESYHLLVDTPRGNLPDCMRYFQGLYSNRIQRSRGTCGYFLKNYEAKSVEVTAENLATLSTIIHLIPAEKKCIDLRKSSLSDYPWSSYRFYLRPSDRPAWLSALPVLDALELPDNRSGLTRYRNLLKKTLAEGLTSSGKFKFKKQHALILKDWAVGSDEFKNKLLDLLEEKLKHISAHSISGGIKKAYELRETERYLHVALEAVGLARDELKKLKKMDHRKQAICWYLKQHTRANAAWITRQLHMGVPNNCSKASRNTQQATDGPLLDLRNILQKSSAA